VLVASASEPGCRLIRPVLVRRTASRDIFGTHRGGPTGMFSWYTEQAARQQPEHAATPDNTFSLRGPAPGHSIVDTSRTLRTVG
jgi:hypothetical protein